MRSTSVCILAVALLSTVVALVSCGQPISDTHLRHTTSNAAPNGAPAAHNDADVVFARHMLPHHQQGVQLAAMVPSHTKNPDLRVIAAHIRADQQAEIQTLNLLLAQWQERAQPDAGAAGHHGMGMAGMVDQNIIDRLQSLHDAEFDTLWTTSMIGHHQGAITMAQDEIAHGLSADAIHAATLIVEAQQREIATMTHLISASQ